MRFLVDANVPLSVAPRIRALGHDAMDVREIAMGSADDSIIARHARENAFCLITPTRISVISEIIRLAITAESLFWTCPMTSVRRRF